MGMSSKQIEYFFNAAQSVDAWDLEQAQMATSTPHMDKEGRKKMEAAVQQMKSTFIKYLIKE